MSQQLVNYLLGSGGAAGLCLILIITRVLVIGVDHREALRNRDSQIEKLQRANDILIQTNEQLKETNHSLSSSGQLTNTVVTTLLEIASHKEAVRPDDPGGQSISIQPKA